MIKASTPMLEHLMYVSQLMYCERHGIASEGFLAESEQSEVNCAKITGTSGESHTPCQI